MANEGVGAKVALTESTARALVAGHLEALLAHREEITSLSADDVRRLAELAIATRADCGGNACG